MMTLTEALSAHGYATPAEARADMVVLVCLDCGCVTGVSPTVRDEAGRQAQQDAYRPYLVCCGEAGSYLI